MKIIVNSEAFLFRMYQCDQCGRIDKEEFVDPFEFGEEMK